MKKALILATALLLSYAAADATTRTSKIEMVYQGQPNGDYRLYLFGSARQLVCEEHNIRIVQQGDAVNPLVIECKH